VRKVGLLFTAELRGNISRSPCPSSPLPRPISARGKGDPLAPDGGGLGGGPVSVQGSILNRSQSHLIVVRKRRKSYPSKR